MIPHDAKAAYDAAAESGVWQGGCNSLYVFVQNGPPGMQMTLAPVGADKACEKLQQLLVLARSCDLPTSPGLIESHIAEARQSGALTQHRFGMMLMEINRRAADELGQCLFMRIPTAKQASIAQHAESWSQVMGRFHSAKYDVIEAAKCYSMARHTACVFHSVRMLEAGLRALKKAARVKLNNPTWFSVLDKVEKKVREDEALRAKHKRPLFNRDRAVFLAAAVNHLHGFRIAWRNRATHVLEERYTEGQAWDIYNAVGLLMRHLAARLKE
jgi:hypothetical protein